MGILEDYFREDTEFKKYDFFKYPEEREDLFNYSKKIAEYLRVEHIENLVIIDRSSRPLYIGVREYLRSKYPNEKIPDIYFMNPKGFKAKEELSPKEIDAIINDCVDKDDLSESPRQVRSKEDILEDFERSYKRLTEDKKKPMLVFDTCIHSGDSLASVKNTLDEAGFSDVRIGSVNQHKIEKIQTDFFITKKHPEKGCYPFDRDRIIEKTFDQVYSKKTDDPDRRAKSIRLRKEIKNIMADFLAKEPK